MNRKLEVIESIQLDLEKQNRSLKPPKWFQIHKYISNYFQKKKNIKNALAFAYSKGYLAGKEEMFLSLKAIEEKTHIVINLSTENEKLLQQNYQNSLDELDKSWRKRCDICRKAVEVEKIRAIKLQQDLQNSLYSFNLIYTKLIKFLSSLDITHDTLLKHLGRVQNSKSHLESIKDEVDRFTLKHTEFLEK